MTPSFNSAAPRFSSLRHLPMRSLCLGLLVASSLTGALSGCAALAVGGAVGGAMMYSDRRTSGMQIEDQTIELKAKARVRETVGDRAHVNVTSYNRTVLITGEVPKEADKAAVGTAIAGVENVRSTLNELAVTPIASLAEMSNDSLLTSKVKASYVDARDISANAFKVVTEHGVVYLMGLVTEREADRAVELARGVSGVRKVVKAFEIISEEDLARRAPRAAAASAPAATRAPASAPASPTGLTPRPL